jgi:steroid delta-isomerase-like uncharacterized protein
MSVKSVDAHRAAHEEWNNRHWDRMADRIGEGFRYMDHARGVDFKTRDEWMDWAKAWADAFPDGRIVESEYLEAGDTSVARFTARGTNDGPLGFFPATGKKWQGDFCEVIRFDDEGRMLAGEMYYDQLSMLTQLGHMEAPGT